MAEELIELGAGKKGPKIPYKRAAEIAVRLGKKIRPWVLFMEVAGSIRRRKPQIGDVELVVLPKNLHKFLEHLADLGFMGGERIQRKLERGVKLEIYIAHKPEELGAMMLTYTGDWQFNVALRRIAKDRGWLLNQFGLYDQLTRDVILKSPYEEDFFGALGVDYHAPEERSVSDRKTAGRMAGGDFVNTHAGYAIFTPDIVDMDTIETTPAGSIAWADLPDSSKSDLSACIGEKLDLLPDQVAALLEGKELPVVLVDPERLIREGGREVEISRVQRYQEEMAKNPDTFPPVVIDSENQEYPLCEGGHRTVAAILENLDRIPAIDVAQMMLVSGQIWFVRNDGRDQ